MRNKVFKQENRRLEAIIKHRLGSVWLKMVGRCLDPSSKNYKDYGGRGITVCEEWKGDRSAFVQWALDNGYKFFTSLDRIDNNKGYSPDNCRWVDKKTQNRNRRNNVYIEFRGERMCIGELAERAGLPYYRVRDRIYRGCDAERAVYDSPNFN